MIDIIIVIKDRKSSTIKHLNEQRLFLSKSEETGTLDVVIKGKEVGGSLSFNEKDGNLVWCTSIVTGWTYLCNDLGQDSGARYSIVQEIIGGK